ncbi:signal recognition particle-docking protein FtsY [Leuconostocaceae bacterium ESL0723]|nr:signal recognition particle-docking protein FtsY [Leuconostocaceae bacterium ESL0723]
MGLFDIFKKRNKSAEETPDSTASESNQAKSQSESTQTATTPAASDSQTHQGPASEAKLSRPLNEKISLVNDSEAAVWQGALTSESKSESESAADSKSQDASKADSASDEQASTSASASQATVAESEQVVVENEEVDDEDDVTDVEDDDKTAYAAGLEKSRTSFADRFNRFLSNFRTVDEAFFEDLEETLIGADVGFELSMRISDELREEVKLQNAKKPADVQNVIIEKMVDIYEADGENENSQMHWAPAGEPTVVLFVGVNGVGKTTTIGKMAERYRKEGKRVLLAAADTFRAGATRQLEEWGQRADVPVVTGAPQADPASVVFEGVKRAKDEGFDLLLVDTAGRLQNNVNLMQELAKMKRIISRELPNAPEEVLLVLDATTGQNALQQAKLFQESSDVTGIVLTKVDGTGKGGIVFAIRSQMHLPVKWIGFGEKASDLRPFKSDEFVYGLFKDLVQ